MFTGISLGEIIIVVLILILAVDRRELGGLYRTIRRYKAQLRQYKDKVRSTMVDIAGPEVRDSFKPVSEYATKNHLRKSHLARRARLAPAIRARASEGITRRTLESPVYRSSTSVMIYASMGAEADTRALISEMLRSGKHVLLPYIRPFEDEVDEGCPMGIGRISDLTADTTTTAKGFLQPHETLWNNYFKSDIDMVLSSVVAFDNAGRVLYRDHSSWQGFLAEMKGRKPLWGLAYSAQACDSPLPERGYDTVLDQIVTEDGVVAGE